MKVYKMQALENDFVIILNNDLDVDKIKNICHRKLGIGCDQLIICDTESYNVKIFNSDASKAKMCLNGLRCLAYLFYFEEAKNEISFHVNSITVKTKYLCENKVQIIVPSPKVITGKYDISSIRLPNLLVKDIVDVGNEHLILFFSKDISKDIISYSNYINTLKIFNDGVNISYCYVMDGYFIKSFVDERGAGFTKACGSAAASIFFVAYKNRMVFNNVTVVQEGGDLNMSFCNQNQYVSQIGDTNLIFKGDYLI